MGARELDTNDVDPSPFPDRLPDDGPGDFEQFRNTIETEGQRIPIQVRPHPQSPGRYQVIYGHRRLRAARELGRPVKALVLEMSDRDLVVSQGIENAARQDLTWIERALFAWRMDQTGIKPRDVMAALSIDDAELARMRAVYRKVPADVIESIGRAPKVGRPRWVDFAKRIEEESTALSSVRKTLSADRVLRSNSNDRFSAALESLKKVRTQPDTDHEVKDHSGKILGRLRVSKKEMRLIVDSPRGAEFAEFVRQELPALVERFIESSKSGDDR
jgi:ParB family transcriptional regulator, chromosome partitioning protein